jgi:hypothetical protein
MQKWMPEGKNILQRDASWVSRQRIFKSLQKGKHASKLQVEDFQSCAKMEASKQTSSRWRSFQSCAKMEASKQALGGGFFKDVQKWKQASKLQAIVPLSVCNTLIKGAPIHIAVAEGLVNPL